MNLLVTQVPIFVAFGGSSGLPFARMLAAASRHGCA
jgi:hypothetical protein